MIAKLQIQSDVLKQETKAMKLYADKFHLTSEQSLFLAKKKWDENVYCGMRMENRNITFPQVKTILQGINVPSVRLEDIQAVLNMCDAWRFMLASMSEHLNFEYWCKVNEYIARNEALECGKLRTGSVGISGTDYLPPVLVESQVRAELEKILTADTTATTKALEAFVWGTRGQFFWDGNKRTSMTLANKILISAGAGFLTVTDRHMERFNTLLVDYYNIGESEALTDFLYENAIQGIF